MCTGPQEAWSGAGDAVFLRRSSVVGGAETAGPQITLCLAKQSQDTGVQRVPSCVACCK